MTVPIEGLPAIKGLALLRKAFPAHQISKLPKPKSKDSPKGRCAECGGWHGLPAVHLDYVGHAALTDRLLDTDPGWTWEPLSFDDKGLPALDANGGLWIKLTVLGVTRLGYGDAQGKVGGDAMKERIGDALRNSAMRFGAALELWHKGDLHMDDEEATPDERPKRTGVAQDVLATNPALPREQTEYLDELAVTLKEAFPIHGPAACYERITLENLDDLQKIYLSTLMPASMRSAIKAESQRRHQQPQKA